MTLNHHHHHRHHMDLMVNYNQIKRVNNKNVCMQQQMDSKYGPVIFFFRERKKIDKTDCSLSIFFFA